MTILEQVRAIREAMDKAGVFLKPEQAATVTYLFKPWKAVDENGNAVHYEVADRRRYNEVVYECRQAHDALAHQTPDIIPALWLRLDVEHAGTMEDPIPFATGMEVFNGKYYIENEILYLCNRDSNTALYNNLADLVGHYVEKVVTE